MNSVDMAKTIAPRSDQLNADDLISGPLTITITAVKGNDSPEQPVSIHFEGDNGKPYKPCLSMRRVMVKAWERDAKAYVGRRMTLFRDDKVQFGGMAVGGIRISHMSHIDRDLTMALTATRAKRTPYTVKPLRAEVVQRPAAQRQDEPSNEAAKSYEASADPAFDAVAWAEKLERELPDYVGVDVLRLDWNEHKDELKTQNPDVFRRVNMAIARRAEEIGKAAAQ